MPNDKKKPKRVRKKSVLTKTSVKRSTPKTKKKKVYFTGSKGGKATYGSKPNKNIIGSVGGTRTKKKKK